MIKTFIAYRMTPASTALLKACSPENLAAADPHAIQWQTLGFTPIYGEWIYQSTGGFMLVVQVRERILPAKVILQRVTEMIADATEQMGRPPNKKEIMELKDKAKLELLPEAFIKHTDIPVVVIQTNQHSSSLGSFLLIGSGSANKVDDIVSLLHVAVDQVDGGLQLKPFVGDLDINDFLQRLLRGGSIGERINELSDDPSEPAIYTFNLGDAANLRGPEKATVRFKDMDILGDTDIEDHVKHGFAPTELHIKFEDKIGFAMNDKGVIKRIKFSDLLLKDVEESVKGESDATYFDGTAALVIGELRQMLKAIRDNAQEEL
jgi:recombination associated protein RdgC